MVIRIDADLNGRRKPHRRIRVYPADGAYNDVTEYDGALLSRNKSLSSQGIALAVLPLRHSADMTILTLNKMYVVHAVGRFKRRVHGFDIQSAVRQAWVALGAGGAGALVMSGVAGQATQTLVHSHARAIIPGTGLESVIGRMALVARRLTHIGRDADPPCSGDNLGKRQELCAEMQLFAAIIETQ
jgi:hypothetical protein